MGVAPLSKVAVIAPRSDYQDVVRWLAQFRQFHPLEGGEHNFDPAVQELAVRAVTLFAQADETVKGLSIPLAPGMLDVVFRGVKIPREEVDAKDWSELLAKMEGQLEPIVQVVRAERIALQKAAKEESNSHALRDALEIVSGIPVDLGALQKLSLIRTVLAVVDSTKLTEFRESLPDLIFLSEDLQEEQSLVLIASPTSEGGRVAKVMKALDVKPISIPEGLPQNPADAYRRLEERYQLARKRRSESEVRLEGLRKEHEARLLAVRELAELAKGMLDQARMAGNLARMATISGYIPSRLEGEFRDSFGRWMVLSEPAMTEGEKEKAPTLMENREPFSQFEFITKEQGTPGEHEVDPTPLISFVFPVFFGVMFGDLGHGLVLTFFALLLRQRGTGSLRQWGNMFLAAGVSASVVGVLVGEFFGFPLFESLHIPGQTLLEIVQRPLGGHATLAPLSGGMGTVLEIALLIGIAHLTTGLALDIVQAAKGHEMVELLTEKVPALTMYLSGVGFGLAFVGAGYSFNVFKQSRTAPLLGVPNSLLGGASLTVVVASMMVLLLGKGIAILAGKSHGESAESAFGNGAIEVFERISAYLANTISYVRLAIMLLIHAALLLVVNMLLSFPIYVVAVPIVIFNILIITFEVVIVYIQDLRLHVYEFFTKFYRGTGTPFKNILSEGVRTKVRWL